MIKFFRKIRYHLMSENKTSSYLKYAIGEIVLVVIGILIALGINNWNENRKAENNNKIMLQKLKEENQITINFLTDDEVYRNQIPEITRSFNSFLKSNNLENQKDSLISSLEEIFNITSYTFTQSNLINYIERHNSDVSELNKELTTLQAHQEDLATISEKTTDFKIKFLYEALEGDIDFNSFEIESYKTLKSLNFRNKLVLIYGLESEITYQFNNTLSQAKKVDSLITERLNY